MFNPCPAEYIMIPHPPNYQPIRLLDPDCSINLHTWWQTVQQKPTDLDLHCLQNSIYLGSAEQVLKLLTFTTNWANSADDKPMIYFFFFPEK